MTPICPISTTFSRRRSRPSFPSAGTTKRRAIVIPEEEGLHAAVMRAVSNCEGVPRTFFFWSSWHNPPQIRELVFH